MVRPLLSLTAVRRILIIVLPAVATACQVYAQHRAALVPHATPMTYDGQPMQSAGELSLGASNVRDFIKPGVGNPEAGDAIPSTQLRGLLGVRAATNWSFGLVSEHGLGAGSTAVKSSEPAIRDAGVSAFGMNASYSIATGTPGFRIGVSTEVLVWSVPWVQYTSCIQNCSVPGFTYSDRGEDSVATLAIGVIPSYRTGPVTIFGGFTARNHPTITEKITTSLPGPADVQEGPYNVTLHVGAELELGAGIRASVLAHQTVTNDPVSYGPGLSLMLTLPLGRDLPALPSPMSGPPGLAPST